MAFLGREATKSPLTSSDLPDNAVTLAKMTGGTDGNIISYDASGDPVAIATGTDGQVLTSTGAGSPPAFEGFPAGHVVSFDSTHTVLSGSHITITGGSNSSDDLDTETDMSITVKSATSKIIICYWTAACAKDTSGRGFMYFRRQVDGATATTMGGFSDGDKGAGLVEGGASPAFYTWGGVHEDTHGQSVGDVLKYFVRIYNNTGATFYWCMDGAAHGGYIMEVLQ